VGNIIHAFYEPPRCGDGQLDDTIKVEQYTNGRDGICHIEIKSLTHGFIQAAVLNQIGISPITSDDVYVDQNVLRRPARSKFGMFLAGVISRINGGSLEVDRREIIPVHARTGRRLPRLMRAIIPLAISEADK
jgi:hypothetical protein